MKLIVLLVFFSKQPAQQIHQPKRASKPTEGTLTREDVTELHYKAWCGVADTFKVDAPTLR